MNYISNMNLLDLIVSTILLLASIRGFRKGLVIEAASFLSIFFGILGGVKFSKFASDIISSFFSLNPTLIKVIAFIIVFLICVRLTSLIANIITKIIKLALLGIINRILGALFGVIKWGIFLSFFIILLGNFVIAFNPITTDYIDNSILYKPLFNLGEKIYSMGTGVSSSYLDKEIIESI